MPARYVLQLCWAVCPHQLRGRHVLFRYSRNWFEHVRHMSRWIVLSRSIISAHCVHSRHLQRCTIVQRCMLDVLGGQVLPGWVGDTLSRGYLQPRLRIGCADSVLDVSPRVMVCTGRFCIRTVSKGQVQRHNRSVRRRGLHQLPCRVLLRYNGNVEGKALRCGDVFRLTCSREHRRLCSL